MSTGYLAEDRAPSQGFDGNVSEPKKSVKLSQISELWKLSRANSSTGALLVLTAFVDDCSARRYGPSDHRHSQMSSPLLIVLFPENGRRTGWRKLAQRGRR